MEIDLTSLETSTEQILWSSDEQDCSLSRSYTCAFCKRGFSNAQALGGHMNIHRRDRAKLNQPSSDDLLSMTVANTNYNNQSQAASKGFSSQSEATELRTRKPKRPVDGDRNFRGKNGIQNLWELSSFEETPSASYGPKMRSFASEREGKSAQLDHGSSITELDLELRLGLEPHESSRPGTRKFL